MLSFLREVRRGFDSPWITALIRESGPRTAENDGLRQALDKIWPARFRLSREIFVRAVERGDLPGHRGRAAVLSRSLAGRAPEVAFPHIVSLIYAPGGRRRTDEREWT
ncbi:hypothetical protein GCM10010182_01810 [Actinomadura cremea]|nr:hypothetical protein GCM10010182_01810 [Actinomadura cremea]